MSYSVRASGPKDREPILAVVREAFSNGGRDGSEEVAVAIDTWSLDAGVPGLDLVAVDGAQIVGHVLGAAGRLGDRPVVGVAPLSVIPSRQHEGIGTALMTELLQWTERDGEPVVVLLGNPEYYRRFGFESGAPLGISYPPVGIDSPHFLVRRFVGYDSTIRGEYRYCWELDR
jgi:putative acetyltransferase